MITQERALCVLENVYGHKSFRPGQLDAIKGTLGGQDTLVVLPTGGGKSLTFQIPPLIKDNCFTVVVCPLVALARDQVTHCQELGIEAEIWNCEVDDLKRRNIVRDLISDGPSLRLLYTTPESLRKPQLRDTLKEAHSMGTLCSFAIDEAHCISQWGHDFRPAYQELTTLRAEFPGVPITALTASCTPEVQRSIVNLLCMRDPVVLKTSFNRPNIAYEYSPGETQGAAGQRERRTGSRGSSGLCQEQGRTGGHCIRTTEGYMRLAHHHPVQ